jgi:hypothetical protein
MSQSSSPHRCEGRQAANLGQSRVARRPPLWAGRSQAATGASLRELTARMAPSRFDQTRLRCRLPPAVGSVELCDLANRVRTTVAETRRRSWTPAISGAPSWPVSQLIVDSPGPAKPPAVEHRKTCRALTAPLDREELDGAQNRRAGGCERASGSGSGLRPRASMIHRTVSMAPHPGLALRPERMLVAIERCIEYTALSTGWRARRAFLTVPHFDAAAGPSSSA